MKKMKKKKYILILLYYININRNYAKIDLK